MTATEGQWLMVCGLSFVIGMVAGIVGITLWDIRQQLHRTKRLITEGKEALHTYLTDRLN